MVSERERSDLCSICGAAPEDQAKECPYIKPCATALPEPSDTVVITAGGDNWFRGVSEGLTDARPHAKAAAAAYEKENMK